MAIEDVPNEVRDYLIKRYLTRIQLINGIFFFAKRMKERAGVCDELECKM